MRALWRAEDFPPLFFGEKCEPSGEQRIFLPCFSEKNASPLTSRGFSSLVFRRKMRALWRAEDFSPLFFGEKCESSGEQRIFSFLKFFLLHRKCKFHDLIRPVIDSGFFIFYNVVAHIAEQCFFFQKQFHHLKRVRDIPAL